MHPNSVISWLDYLFNIWLHPPIQIGAPRLSLTKYSCNQFSRVATASREYIAQDCMRVLQIFLRWLHLNNL